jgi:hypothetical protein
MTADSIPQLLDDAVHNCYLSAVATRQYDLLPEILVEAANRIQTPPDPATSGEYSAGNALCLMVDTIRVMNGEIGTVGREPQRYHSDKEGRYEQAVVWQRWIHALESLSLVTGASLGTYPQALREEFVNLSGPGISLGETERMVRLWKESTAFMLKWLRWSRTHNFQEAEREEDWHLKGLHAIISFSQGLRKNWNERGKSSYGELSDWAADQSDWGRLLKASCEMYTDNDGD